MAVVRALQPEAERILNHPLKLDCPQDASYFAELFVFEDGAVGSNGASVMVFKIALRFSSFGKMATVHTNSAASDLALYPVAQLEQILEKAGFQFIPAESLSERYDGKLKGLGHLFGSKATWWYRFFDYM
ncbi:MAG: hypothetical protein U0791_11565 [Gemmataceae bacterium]